MSWISAADGDLVADLVHTTRAKNRSNTETFRSAAYRRHSCPPPLLVTRFGANRAVMATALAFEPQSDHAKQAIDGSHRLGSDAQAAGEKSVRCSARGDPWSCGRIASGKDCARQHRGHRRQDRHQLTPLPALANGFGICRDQRSRGSPRVSGKSASACSSRASWRHRCRPSWRSCWDITYSRSTL
jgi:hypothetical protein